VTCDRDKRQAVVNVVNEPLFSVKQARNYLTT
jgi:hypothetical protein